MATFAIPPNSGSATAAPAEHISAIVEAEMSFFIDALSLLG
ncbi:MAG: hypothetical protein NXH88_07155 [Hyphomonas sp.]|nr:hypothetical protein [Hyphomonas sp.]